MTSNRKQKRLRLGGVYIAVLGTSLIVALLGLAALVAQRIQNRIVLAAGQMRQAQLNAHSAAELALLTMRDDTNWRTSQPNGPWFTNRDTGAGTCSAQVTDPIDATLTNDAEESVLVEGIGRQGAAEQRVRLTVDAHKQPLASLKSAVAVGDTIDLQGDTLRTDGMITTNQISAAGSFVFGDVEAATISGSTYVDTATQIDSAKLPMMPNWSSVFNYYRANGTQIAITSVPLTLPSNFIRNPGIELPVQSNDRFWTGKTPGMPTVTADVDQTNNWSHNGSNSLRVRNRTSWQAGAVQRIEHFVKPNQQYDVDAWASLDVGGLLSAGSRAFHISLHVKGTNDASALVVTTPSDSASWTVVLGIALLSNDAHITGRLTVPEWSGDLEYAFIKIADASSTFGTGEFFVDDVVVREVVSGRYIFRRVLSRSFNPFGASNAQGIYWINCGGQKITIERSRIAATLLLVNPGPGSSIANGPIHWTPAVAGYPALLIDADDPAAADFAIRASTWPLSETDQGTNFNPAHTPHSDFSPSSDGDTNDIYESMIQGLIAVEGDLAYYGTPLVRGQVLVGGNIANASGELKVEYQRDSLLNPPPGFLGPFSHIRRPASFRKAVLP
jgi:hypothetical protein